jgi:hypothetical protein
LEAIKDSMANMQTLAFVRKMPFIKENFSIVKREIEGAGGGGGGGEAKVWSFTSIVDIVSILKYANMTVTN